MRKTFPLAAEGKHPERLLEATKHEIRKYVKRERRRDLPPGVDFWDFDCQIGTNQAEAKPVHLAAITEQIDAIVLAGGAQFYLEILAKHGVRKARPVEDSPAE